MAVGRLAQKSLSARTPAVTAHHVGGKTGLINEHQFGSVKGRLFGTQCVTCSLDVRPVLLAGVKCFF